MLGLTERRALALCNLSLRMALLNVYRVQKRVNIFFVLFCGVTASREAGIVEM